MVKAQKQGGPIDIQDDATGFKNVRKSIYGVEKWRPMTRDGRVVAARMTSNEPQKDEKVGATQTYSSLE